MTTSTWRAVRLSSSLSQLPEYALKPAFTPNKAAAAKFNESLAQTAKHAEGTTSFWAKVSVFVALPAILLVAVNTYFVEKEHYEHRQHLAKVSDEDWPVQYEFQNIRSKPFFWGDGDKTLWWNPVINRNVKN
ncbi:hypothetical protein TBLA_0F00360 [Henningerozyma blattae CBS 6284]|uniref:Cytochrome c oxidase subunit 13, mitochondrial n=1 Tax=Henningerozyma blattae (strain ATCC 34711 / CBS 6284 / DSM 70876 / NBRC 10599 / NRRL Y-10934 / UCD 77-7) TaxID=1071380 RepID=I2H5C8_HENB6|nr:hypothetical protein TBLA_0F00360 [Tetrapisispora blattae CBS 6284]CCH61580.1 hypothetical protein TBLA_0F00360 [Tetrapisispora blattae CBS 6284]